MNKRGWYVYIHKQTGRLSRWEPIRGVDDEHYTAHDPDEYKFEAALRYVDIERGRSAAHFLWTDAPAGADVSRWDEHQTYVMFMQQIGEMLKEGIAITETMYGVWRVVKRGTDYGIKLDHQITPIRFAPSHAVQIDPTRAQ